jgi:hypothetical protein
MGSTYARFRVALRRRDSIFSADFTSRVSRIQSLVDVALSLSLLKPPRSSWLGTIDWSVITGMRIARRSVLVWVEEMILTILQSFSRI